MSHRAEVVVRHPDGRRETVLSDTAVTTEPTLAVLDQAERDALADRPGAVVVESTIHQPTE